MASQDHIHQQGAITIKVGFNSSLPLCLLHGCTLSVCPVWITLYHDCLSCGCTLSDCLVWVYTLSVSLSCRCTLYQTVSPVVYTLSVCLSHEYKLYQTASCVGVYSIRLPHTHLLIFPSQLSHCLPLVRLLFCKAFYKRLISFNMAEIFD